MVRAPGGQLITRIKTEAAAGKLSADVINHSDRGLMLDLQDLFQDYAPPNAADYREDVLVSPKIWPRSTLGWSIAYNTELVKNPPKTWMDLTKPEYGNKQIGQVVGPSGGTTWTASMFERQVLGEDYWKKQAATAAGALSLRRAAVGRHGARRGLDRALLYNIVYIKKRDGAPVGDLLPAGRRSAQLLRRRRDQGRGKPQRRQAVPQLVLSEEGQAFQIKELGYLTALKTPPLNPPGYDPKVMKTWAPKFERVREAAQRLARGVEQDLRLSPVDRANRRRDGLRVEIDPRCARAVGAAHRLVRRPSPVRSAELIEAAKKEGSWSYTANVAEVEQLVIEAFNKRFPFVKVEMLRAPGGQLITRVKTEAAAGKLRPTSSTIPTAA